MYTLTVQLIEVRCIKTESDLSSDKFVLNGVLYTEEGQTVGVALPIIRINDGEARDLTRWSFTLQSEKRIVNLALAGWDIDQNDSWTENEDKLAAIAASIAAGVGAANPVAGTIVAAAAAATKEVIDLFTGWDANDHLFQWNEKVSLGGMVFADQPFSQTLTANFRGDGAIADVNYSLTLAVSSSVDSDPDPVRTDYAQLFRDVNSMASADGFAGAFPTCISFSKPGGAITMSCVCLSRDQAEWRDVPHRELQFVDLGDFAERMRRTQVFATDNHFRAGFPNYFDATYQERVCGTLLLTDAVAEWRDLDNINDLHGVPLDDIGRRFQETQYYAQRNGFVGAFPNLNEATYDGRTVCGTVLIKPGNGTIREYTVQPAIQ
jgi:hypothetical protein